MRALLGLFLMFVHILIAEETRDQNRLKTTLTLLHDLGPKSCAEEVEKANSDRFSNISLKKHQIHQAVKMAYNFTFKIFNRTLNNYHWNKKAFNELMGHLKIQAIPVVRAKLKMLAKDFKQLDDYLTRENLNFCDWEIARNDILKVFGQLINMTLHKERRKNKRSII